MEAFHARRTEFGLSKLGLSRAAGLSGAYVQQIETGRLQNPSADTRAALALVLEIDSEVLFAGFPTPRSVTVAERRRQELRLYAEGKSQLEIAELLGIPRSLVALDLQQSPGYTPRPSLFTFKPNLGSTNSVHQTTRGRDAYRAPRR